MEINIGKLYKYERRQIADNLFVASVFVAFLGSMNVWFMVPLHTYFPILAFLLALASYLISRHHAVQYLRDPTFCCQQRPLPCLNFISAR